MTTVVSFVAALGGITVTGIQAVFSHPPDSLNSADLPAKWVMSPITENPQSMTIGSCGGWPNLKASLVVAVQAVGQGSQGDNWTSALTMFDAVDAAIKTSAAGSLGKGKIEWITRQGFVKVAGVDYWAIIAEVTAHG